MTARKRLPSWRLEITDNVHGAKLPETPINSCYQGKMARQSLVVLSRCAAVFLLPFAAPSSLAMFSPLLDSLLKRIWPYTRAWQSPFIPYSGSVIAPPGGAQVCSP